MDTAARYRVAFWWFRLAVTIGVILVFQLAYKWHGWVAIGMGFLVGFVTVAALDVARWSYRQAKNRHS